MKHSPGSRGCGRTTRRGIDGNSVVNLTLQQRLGTSSAIMLDDTVTAACPSLRNSGALRHCPVNTKDGLPVTTVLQWSALPPSEQWECLTFAGIGINNPFFRPHV